MGNGSIGGWLRGALIAAAAMGASVQAAPAPEVYGRLPEVELMRLAPSGRHYAFIAVVGEERRLAVVDEAGKLLYSTPVGTAKVRDLSWAGDDHLLVTVSTTFDYRLVFAQAFELYGVLNIDVPKRSSSMVFKQSASVADIVLGSFGSGVVDGQRRAYFGGLTYVRDSGNGQYVFRHGYRDLYSVDLDTGKASRLDKGEGHPHDWVVTPQGEVIAHSEYEERSGHWTLFEGKRTQRQLLSRDSPLDQVDLLGLGRSPGSLLVADGSGDRDALLELTLNDGKAEELFADRSTEDYFFDPETGLLLGARIAEEPGALLFDERLQARYLSARKAFSGFQLKLVSYSRNFDRLLVFTDGGDDSGTYWLVDIASRKADPIANAYGKIAAEDVGPTSLLHYKSGDGLAIEAVLTLPPAAKPDQALPLVVMPHGGPIGVRDRLGFDWWAQAYASAGYAVLQPNYRGSSGYGRAFLDAGYGQWGRLMQTDLSDGVKALAQAGRIDPARVCIVGGSYGGYAALAGVALQRGIYRCAVSVGGVSDLAAFFNWQVEGHGYRSGTARFWQRAIGGSGSQVRDISPAMFADKVEAPVLLIHGRDDTIVPIEQSRLMEAALRKADKPVTLLALDGEDHWLSREATRMSTLKASLDFVRQHNPP
ncbi:hypothetical protein WQQ_19080 [Hydrocarboniphaga effusa AP103]|uniref:Peptidase S9 prolyl oligopeptidase catalytic domain-containing protein n=3 Tax=Nevskiaceae TaxID=568386 RepID=I8I5K2_9GAMM|nr:hypothetical protein WQQ_19080 [Hydrocarboniphaga effusa AP103]